MLVCHGKAKSAAYFCQSSLWFWSSEYPTSIQICNSSAFENCWCQLCDKDGSIHESPFHFISVQFKQRDLFLALEWIIKLSFSCALAGDKMATKSLGNGLEIRTQIIETGQKCVTCSSEFSCGFSFLCSCERTRCVARCWNQDDDSG